MNSDEIKRKITEIDNEISFHKKKIDLLGDVRQLNVRVLELAKRNEFSVKHGRSSGNVRDEYRSLLESNSHQGGRGYDVYVDGYNPEGIHHWMLKPECRNICMPSQMVLDAFDVIDKEVKISEKPTLFVWGPGH